MSYLPAWRTRTGAVHRITRAIVLALTRVGTVGSMEALWAWFITSKNVHFSTVDDKTTINYDKFSFTLFVAMTQ